MERKKRTEILQTTQTGDSELIAVALLRRSEALREYGNLGAATADIDKALSYAKHAGPHIQGHVLTDAGRLHAQMAQSNADRTYAQNLFDQAGHIARIANFEEDPHFVTLGQRMVDTYRL